MSEWVWYETEIPPAGVDLIIITEDGDKILSRLRNVQYDLDGHIDKITACNNNGSEIKKWMICP